MLDRRQRGLAIAGICFVAISSNAALDMIFRTGVYPDAATGGMPLAGEGWLISNASGHRPGPCGRRRGRGSHASQARANCAGGPSFVFAASTAAS